MKKDRPSNREKRTQNASVKRREREKEAMRKNILKAASHEFLEHGYEDFSLRRVAERIGYTPTTIYLYFRNKDDLLHRTVLEGFLEFDAQIADVAAAHPDPLERVEALGNFYVQFGMSNSALYRLMFMQRSDLYLMPRFHEEDVNAENLSPLNPQGQTPQILAQKLLVQAIEEAMENGSIPTGDAKLKADVLWVGVHGLVSLAISPLISAEYAPTLQEELIHTLMKGAFSSEIRRENVTKQPGNKSAISRYFDAIRNSENARGSGRN